MKVFSERGAMWFLAAACCVRGLRQGKRRALSSWVCKTLIAGSGQEEALRYRNT
jgi:hypothetical protein